MWHELKFLYFTQIITRNQRPEQTKLTGAVTVSVAATVAFPQNLSVDWRKIGGISWDDQIYCGTANYGERILFSAAVLFAQDGIRVGSKIIAAGMEI